MICLVEPPGGQSLIGAWIPGGFSCASVILTHHRKNTMIDVYVKDEGYADIKFLSIEAMEWAYGQGVSNDLLEVGDTFCGKPVWKPGMAAGVFTTAVSPHLLPHIMKAMEIFGLTTESEI